MIPLTTLESYASQVARTSVTISCDAPAAFATDDPNVVTQGYTVSVDGVFLGEIHLPRDRCQRLQHLDAAQTIDPLDVLTLMHEATHIALSSTDECRVEAVARANEWQLVRLFRLAAWRAKAILWGAKIVETDMLAEYHGCTA